QPPAAYAAPLAYIHATHPHATAQRPDAAPPRLVDIAHHAPAHARVLREPPPQHLGERQPRQVPHHLGDDGARLGAAEIEPGHDLAVPAHAPPSPPPSAVALRRTITWPAQRASRSTYERPLAARSSATSPPPRIPAGPPSRPPLHP